MDYGLRHLLKLISLCPGQLGAVHLTAVAVGPEEEETTGVGLGEGCITRSPSCLQHPGAQCSDWEVKPTV